MSIKLKRVQKTSRPISPLSTHFFVKANWHFDIVDRASEGFLELIPAEKVDVFGVLGAFELRLLSQTGRYAAVVCAAFAVDGGIYRQDIVAQVVVDGLRRTGMNTGVSVFSVC